MLLNLIHLNIKDATQSMYLKDRGTLYFTDEQQATYLVNQHIDIIKSILQKIQTNPYVEVFIEQNVAKEINNNLFLIDNIENFRVYEPFKVDEKSQSYDDHVLEEHMIPKDSDVKEESTDKHERDNTETQESNSIENTNELEEALDEKFEDESEIKDTEKSKENSDDNNFKQLQQESKSVDEDDEIEETAQQNLSISQIYEMISSLDSYENKNNIEQVGEVLGEQFMIRNANNNEYLTKDKRESILKGLLLHLFNERHLKGVETDMTHAFNEFNINDILKEKFKDTLKEQLHQMDSQDIEYFIFNNFYHFQYTSPIPEALDFRFILYLKKLPKSTVYNSDTVIVNSSSKFTLVLSYSIIGSIFRLSFNVSILFSASAPTCPYIPTVLTSSLANVFKLLFFTYTGYNYRINPTTKKIINNTILISI